jgi:hypothetical protein
MKKEKQASKKQISKALMPQIGDIIEGYRINYVNYMQFRITCSTKTLPEMGRVLDLDSKLFKVCHLNFGEDRFSAEFIGFKENEVPEAPEVKNEVVNLLD